jgi:predicted nucleotidyltransferase
MKNIETDISFSVDNEQLSHLCLKYNVASLRIFGSVNRGEATEQSDIDLLANFARPLSLLTLIHFERELSNLFGRKVDLVTEQALSPYFRSSVLTASRVIYDAPR